MAIQPFAMQGTTPNVMLPSEALYNAGKAKAVENENLMFNQQQAEQSKLDQLYRESGGDINAMIKNPDLGFGAGMKLRTVANENAKLQAQAGTEQAKQDKLRIQGGIEKLNYGSQLLQGAKANPAMWPDISAEFKSMTGIDLGDQYDPAKVDALISQGVSQKDMLGNEWKQKGYDIDVMRLNETQRHNSAMENKPSGGGDGGSSADWVIDKESGKRYNRATGEVLPLLENGKEYAPPVVKPKGSTMTGTEIKLENDIRSATSKAVDVGDKIAGHLKALELGTLKPGAESTIRTAVASKTGYFGNDNTDAMASLMQDAAEARDAVLAMNAGVQTDGDAERAYQRILTSKNDPNMLKTALEKLVDVQSKAVMSKQLEGEAIRSNRGLDAVDYAGEYRSRTGRGNAPQQPPDTGAPTTGRPPLSAFGGR